MADFIVLHGSGGIDMWIPWLEKELKNKTSDVWVPTLPDPGEPDLKKQLPFMLESNKIGTESTIIGHSASCPLILSLLENLDIAVKKVILVAGYIKPLMQSKSDPILQDDYDWDKIKKSAKEFVFVVSDNDPWGCGEEMNRPIFEQVGGTFVIVHDGGHFGSNTFKSPLYEFPLLLGLI